MTSQTFFEDNWVEGNIPLVGFHDFLAVIISFPLFVYLLIVLPLSMLVLDIKPI